MGSLIGSPWLVVAAAAITILALVVPLQGMIATYRGSDRRRPVDVTSRGYAAPAELGPILGRLFALGFQRLGEAQLGVPGIRAVELEESGMPQVTGARTNQHVTWILADSTGMVTAEVVAIPGVVPLVSLSTGFSDGSVVETMYPIGERIDTLDFHSGHVTQGVDEAYSEQQMQIARWRGRGIHGYPRVTLSMADYLRADAAYRQRFAKRKLRGVLVRKQLVPALVFGAIVLMFAMVALARWPR